MALLWVIQVFNPSVGPGGGECYGVACVDLDQDSIYDVIIASEQGVDYYHNDGSANFTSIRLYSDPANAVLAGELVKDDGYLDLLVATSEENRILVNTGNDTNFNPILLGETEVSYAAALSDFDLDGDLDIFVAGETSRLYRNDQDSFAPIQVFPKGFAVSFADYNTDGRPDFALATESGIDFYEAFAGGFVPDTSISAVAPRGLCWFDCDTNGFLDLAVADSAGPNLLIKRTLSGFSAQTIGTVIAPSVAVAAGNFWGEPGVDLLFINHGTADHLYRGSLDGTFSPTPDDSISFGEDKGRALALADLDEEEGIDAVVVGPPANAIYYSDVTIAERITVHLKGRRDLVASLSNTIAAGALLELYENGTLRGFWEITAGSGHAGQDAAQKILPLPTTTGYILVVEWPRSGVIDSIPLDTFSSPLPLEVYAYEDITPPLPPTDLTCKSHDPLVWSNDNQVEFDWGPGDDLHGSGLRGYSILWSKDTLAYPDNSVETAETFGVFSTGLEGDSCFFFISSVDSVGNVSTPLRYTPLKFDFHPPDSIELIHPSPYSYLNDSLIRYEWTAGIDTLSGIAFYSVEVSNRHDFLLEKADSVYGLQDTFYQSETPLREEEHFWRLIFEDAAGNTDTIPSQQNDTLGIPFNVDVTAPVVIMRGVFPQPGALAATNTKIIVQFNEPMLPGLARADTNYILQQNNMDVPFTVDSLDHYRFMLNPTNLLEPNNDYTYVKVRQRITDLAGNRLAADTFFWSFRTDKAPDMDGPEVDLVTLDPNPTGGQNNVNIEARATDENHGGGVPIRCIFFIEGSPDTNEMELADGTYNTSVELYTFDLDVDTFDNRSYLLSFKAMDGSENWGSVRVDTLDVSDDITHPELMLDVLNDTTELYVGDTLSLEITSTEPLRQLYMLFSQITEEDSFYRQHSVPITESSDSTFFEVDVHLAGFPTGTIKANVRGEDIAGNPDTLSFEFNLISSGLLPLDKAFAAPNPASDEVGIYFTPGERVEASLRVFTIDGQEVWTANPIEIAQGGERSVFTTNVSDWPVGLYIFVLQATNNQGQKARVKKIFAVIR